MAFNFGGYVTFLSPKSGRFKFTKGKKWDKNEDVRQGERVVKNMVVQIVKSGWYITSDHILLVCA